MAWWVAVKWRWHLHVDGSEKTWLTDHLAGCGWPTVTKSSRPALGTASRASGGASASGTRITASYFHSGSLDTEWVQIKNRTHSRKTLTGSTLRDAASHVYTFPTLRHAGGAYVKVHTGSGGNTARNLYWAGLSPSSRAAPGSGTGGAAWTSSSTRSGGSVRG